MESCLASLLQASIELNVGGHAFLTRVCTILERAPNYVAKFPPPRVVPSAQAPSEDAELAVLLGVSPTNKLAALALPVLNKAWCKAVRRDGGGSGPRGSFAEEFGPFRVFVDRDGTHFRYILNFLRDGQVVLPVSRRALTELLAEVQYYGLQNLERAILDALERAALKRPRKLAVTPAATSSTTALSSSPSHAAAAAGTLAVDSAATSPGPRHTAAVLMAAAAVASAHEGRLEPVPEERAPRRHHCNHALCRHERVGLDDIEDLLRMSSISRAVSDTQLALGVRELQRGSSASAAGAAAPRPPNSARSEAREEERSAGRGLRGALEGTAGAGLHGPESDRDEHFEGGAMGHAREQRAAHHEEEEEEVSEGEDDDEDEDPDADEDADAETAAARAEAVARESAERVVGPVKDRKKSSGAAPGRPKDAPGSGKTLRKRDHSKGCLFKDRCLCRELRKQLAEEAKAGATGPVAAPERERATEMALGDVKETQSVTISLQLPRSPDKVFYTWEEIARHNKADDCWLVVNGRVYDATAFIPYHPAGTAAILRHAGQDCTLDFNFHSKTAQKLWSKLQIGRVRSEGPRCVVC
jgi:predicted heme/steroid binding protein